jgi:hypothetical protein
MAGIYPLLELGPDLLSHFIPGHHRRRSFPLSRLLLALLVDRCRPFGYQGEALRTICAASRADPACRIATAGSGEWCTKFKIVSHELHVHLLENGSGSILELRGEPHNHGILELLSQEHVTYGTAVKDRMR